MLFRSQENRAGYNPDTFTISLLKGADLSSTLHEGGHFYLEALAELASRPEAPQQIKDDFRKTLDWFGITGNENVQPGTRGGDLGQSPLNENFKKWFGDSKVVDKDGRPLVVYHGSAVGGITKSDTRATFFSSSNEVANSYAENAPASDFPGAEEERINQAVHLRMVNTLVLDGEGGDWHKIGRAHV